LRRFAGRLDCRVAAAAAAAAAAIGGGCRGVIDRHQTTKLNHDSPQSTSTRMCTQRFLGLVDSADWIVSAHLEQHALEKHFPLVSRGLLGLAQDFTRLVNVSCVLFQAAAFQQYHCLHFRRHLPTRNATLHQLTIAV
jgi:hypothetical protein